MPTANIHLFFITNFTLKHFPSAILKQINNVLDGIRNGAIKASMLFIASLGLLRFDNIYSRLHATTKATFFGILLLIIGIALFFSAGVIWIKSILVILFIYLTAPLAAHSIAKSYKERNEKSD